MEPLFVDAVNVRATPSRSLENPIDVVDESFRLFFASQLRSGQAEDPQSGRYERLSFHAPVANPIVFGKDNPVLLARALNPFLIFDLLGTLLAIDVCERVNGEAERT